MLLTLLLTALLAAPLPPASSSAPLPPADDPAYLYKVTLVRAAPGKLLDLIALQRNHMPAYAARGDAPPFWMRHSQGDQWDLMLVFPMESYAAFYHPDRLAQRNAKADDEAAFRTSSWTASVLPGSARALFCACG